MGRSRIVIPKSTRIEISEGDWIEIKDVLNAGDVRRLESVGLKPPVMVGDRIITPIDWAVYELERSLIYLTAWSLVGEDPNKTLPLNMDTMKALDNATFNEINKAILQHIANKAKEKNAPAGSTTDSPSGTTNEPASDQISL